MAEVWEHGPKVYTVTPDKRALLENVLSTDAFLATLDKQEAEGQLLTWGMDVNAVRFVDGAREVMNGDSHDIVDRSSAAELMADGCTLQVLRSFLLAVSLDRAPSYAIVALFPCYETMRHRASQ